MLEAYWVNLNNLEYLFFDRILNAELDVPVPATLSIGNQEFEVTIVPEIDSNGFFVLKYFNAPAYDPEPETEEDGVGSVSMSFSEAAGQHPSFRQAWLQSLPVALQLRPTTSSLDHIPPRTKESPKLEARVHLADIGHRGKLGLVDNQVTVQDSKLKTTQFCIVDIPDYVHPHASRLALDT